MLSTIDMFDERYDLVDDDSAKALESILKDCYGPRKINSIYIAYDKNQNVQGYLAVGERSYKTMSAGVTSDVGDLWTQACFNLRPVQLGASYYSKGSKVVGYDIILAERLQDTFEEYISIEELYCREYRWVENAD